MKNLKPLRDEPAELHDESPGFTIIPASAHEAALGTVKILQQILPAVELLRSGTINRRAAGQKAYRLLAVAPLQVRNLLAASYAIRSDELIRLAEDLQGWADPSPTAYDPSPQSEWSRFVRDLKARLDRVHAKLETGTLVVEDSEQPAPKEEPHVAVPEKKSHGRPPRDAEKALALVERWSAWRERPENKRREHPKADFVAEYADEWGDYQKEFGADEPLSVRELNNARRTVNRRIPPEKRP